MLDLMEVLHNNGIQEVHMGGMMRLLGKRWVQLHRLVYPIGALACLHYLWLVKADLRWPLAFIVLYLVLMAARWPKAWRVHSEVRP